MALSCISAAHCLRVGEAASIRPRDISVPFRIQFYDFKTKNQWIPTRSGPWVQAWCQALLKNPLVQRQPQVRGGGT